MTRETYPALISIAIALVPFLALVYMALLYRVRRKHPALVDTRSAPSSIDQWFSARFRGELHGFFRRKVYRVIDDRVAWWLAQILLWVGRIYWLLWLLILVIAVDGLD